MMTRAPSFSFTGRPVWQRLHCGLSIKQSHHSEVRSQAVLENLWSRWLAWWRPAHVETNRVWMDGAVGARPLSGKLLPCTSTEFTLQKARLCSPTRYLRSFTSFKSWSLNITTVITSAVETGLCLFIDSES